MSKMVPSVRSAARPRRTAFRSPRLFVRGRRSAAKRRSAHLHDVYNDRNERRDEHHPRVDFELARDAAQHRQVDQNRRDNPNHQHRRHRPQHLRPIPAERHSANSINFHLGPASVCATFRRERNLLPLLVWLRFSISGFRSPGRRNAATYFLVDGRPASQMANSDIMKLAKSVSRCAASVAMAKLLDQTPPTISSTMNVRQRTLAIMSFLRACLSTPSARSSRWQCSGNEANNFISFDPCICKLEIMSSQLVGHLTEPDSGRLLNFPHTFELRELHHLLVAAALRGPAVQTIDDRRRWRRAQIRRSV